VVAKENKGIIIIITGMPIAATNIFCSNLLNLNLNLARAYAAGAAINIIIVHAETE